MSAEEPCRLCNGAACEEGCGRCDQSPSVAGPNAHRWCRRCSGSGVEPDSDDTKKVLERLTDVYTYIDIGTYGRGSQDDDDWWEQIARVAVDSLRPSTDILPEGVVEIDGERWEFQFDRRVLQVDGGYLVRIIPYTR